MVGYYITLMKLEVSSKRERTKLVVIFAGLGFAAAFLSAPFILNAVFGAEIPETYNETMIITEDAADQTRGLLITNYIDNVKEDICKTLVNATEYQRCLEI